MNHNIAIDGPAGAGKSTIAKLVAQELGSVYVDTGALYRAIAVHLLKQKVDPADLSAVENALSSAEVSIRYEEGQQHVLLNGDDITSSLRTEEVGNMASASSAIPAVRAKLLELQRNLGRTMDVVMDGRDIGTVVLPDAQVKIFLTAKVETRALRRLKELQEKGIEVSLEKVEADIRERDERDSTRAAAPLKKAEDAHLVDSSELSIEEVRDTILRIFYGKNGIAIAESAGFCFGVKRAVRLLSDCLAGGEKPICTLGPIIHNEYVVRDLEKQGVLTLPDEDAAAALDHGTIVLRSHGVSEEVFDRISATGCAVIDATCPFVKKIHEIVTKESEEGRQIIIVGDKTHPEVIGTMGWSKTPCIVIASKEEAQRLSIPPKTPITVVAQTTFNLQKFKELVEIIQKLGYDGNVLNTICNATSMRQLEAETLAGKVDIMLVCGSGTSSNTRKLYEISKERCVNTYYIQSLDDLKAIHFQSDSCVGITAGASTPNYIIMEVSKYVRRAKL